MYKLEKGFSNQKLSNKDLIELLLNSIRTSFISYRIIKNANVL
jgi:hypothetical protein